MKPLVAVGLGDLGQHHARLGAGVRDDLTKRLFQGATGDGDAHVLIVVLALEVGNGLQSPDEGNAAARHHAFLDRRAGRVQGVLDAGLLLLHLDLGRGAHLDDSNAAGELRHPLLELLAVVVGRGLLDLLSDLGHPPVDRALLRRRRR